MTIDATVSVTPRWRRRSLSCVYTHHNATPQYIKEVQYPPESNPTLSDSLPALLCYYVYFIQCTLLRILEYAQQVATKRDNGHADGHVDISARSVEYDL